MSLADARAAAQKLVEVQSNAKGGAALYKRYRSELGSIVAQLPAGSAAERAHVQRLLAAMDVKMVPKTPGTWRPFVCCAMRALLADEDSMAACVKAAHLKFDFLAALDVAEKDAELFAEGNLPTINKQNAKALVPRPQKVKSEPRSQGSADSEGAAFSTPRLKRAKVEGEKVELHESSMDSALLTEGCPAETAPQQDQSVDTSPAKSKLGLARFMVAKQTKIAPGVLQHASPVRCSSSTTENKRKVSVQGVPNSDMKRVKTAQNIVTEDAVPEQLGKSSTSAHANSATSGNDPKGYYACLGLSTAASAEEIRSAFRKTVLRHHPDKGGDASLFRATVCAWNVLSDPDRRAGYDGRAFTPSSSALCASETETNANNNHQIAKDVYARMHVTPEKDWGRLLQGIDSSIIEVLAHDLEAAIMCTSKVEKRKVKTKGAQGYDAQEESTLVTPDELCGTDSDYAEKGFKRKSDGTWWVQVAWRGFKVTTAEPIEAMERAVDLHMALIQARNAAMLRYKEALSDLKKMNCARNAAATDLDNCPVLTEGEFLLVLQVEPYILLSCSSDLPKPRLQTNWASFWKAMHFRMLVRCVQAQSLDKVDELKAKMSTEARYEKVQRISSRRRAADLLKQVAAQCKQLRILDKPTRRQMSADDADKPLALTEVAFEDLQAIKASQKAIQAEIRALKDAHEASAAMRESSQERQIQELNKKLDLLEERCKYLQDSQKEEMESISKEKDKLQEQLFAARHSTRERRPGLNIFNTSLHRYHNFGVPAAALQEEDDTNRKIQAAEQAVKRAYRAPVPTELEPPGAYGRIH